MKYSLRELRARHGYSQYDMAKMLSVSLPTYRNWEKNFARVKVGDGFRVADIFGVEMKEIKL